MSDVDKNIEVVRRLETAYNERDYDTVRDCVAADFVSHTPGSQMVPPGVEGAITANEGAFTYFSDKRSEILEVFGEGDRVVSHVRMTGTNDGGIAWAGVLANGKPIDVDWIQISRFGGDGKIAETWAQQDIMKMMSQVGAIPAPEGM
jgi:predicted ester cyclase